MTRFRVIEKTEQEALVKWFKLTYPEELIMAIPNGLARAGSASQSVKGGLLPGAPDLFIAAGRKHYYGLFIELKRPSIFGSPAGKPSTNQIDVLARLNRLGYLAVLSYGWVEAAKTIEEYLND